MSIPASAIRFDRTLTEVRRLLDLFLFSGDAAVGDAATLYKLACGMSEGTRLLTQVP